MAYQQEKVTPYNNGEEKSKQVENMFDHIAPAYDTLNHRLSWDIDKLWRKKALEYLHQYAPQQILDIATGTGDFAIMAVQLLHPRHLIGVDISEGMMDIGRKKVKAVNLQNIISFKKEDCMSLSFADNTFDAVTVAFGIRNFQDLDRGLSEMFRVLKKNGHLSIVELTRPLHFPMRQLFWIYSHTLLPLYGKMLSKDIEAYRYLTASIEVFPQGEMMMSILKKVGFNNTSFKRFTFGICTWYHATK